MEIFTVFMTSCKTSALTIQERRTVLKWSNQTNITGRPNYTLPWVYIGPRKKWSGHGRNSQTAYYAYAMGIELSAVPRGLAKRVNRGNRVVWEFDDVVVDSYYHGIWINMCNSLVVSLTKRFQGK